MALKGFRVDRVGGVGQVLNTSTATVTFDRVVFDTESGFDLATELFTVPASLNGAKMRFFGAVSINARKLLEVGISVGGDTVTYVNFRDAGTLVVWSGPITVNTGDTASLLARLDSGAQTIFASDKTWFAGCVA